ncbi:hypothetical protein Tco_0914514 [Tanacetum coccineum]
MKLRDEQTGRKFEECKAIFTEDRSPLYTPFYYSPEEIEYFSANSGFSNDEKHETEKAEVSKALATLDIAPNVKLHYAEEALVHDTMESLKKIRINHPLLKEIRWTDNYAKHMKDLVANELKTWEDNEVRMNPRCSALLQNQLPPKEQDQGSFILPYSIGRLDFNNALADLGASINVMPFSMYTHLGMVKLKPISMVIEMGNNTKCTPKGIVKNLLIKTIKFIFPVEFVILDMVEDFRMPIILGRPLLAIGHAKFNRLLGIDPDIFSYDIDIHESYEEIVYRMTDQAEPCEIEALKETNMETYLTHTGKKVHWCEAILQGKENVHQYWASSNPYSDICDGEGLSDNKDKHYWESMNDSERREKFDEDQDDIEVDDGEDPKECGEDKENAILEVVLDNLYEAWFNDEKAYKERKCRLLGLTYREPPSILIEKVKDTRYIIGPEETYTKVKILGIDEMPRTRDNIATTKAWLMEEIGADEGARGET